MYVRRVARFALAARWTLVASLVCAACGGDDAAVDASPRAWGCPAGWVAGSRGGCGPAVLRCAPGGEAREGACAGVDLARPAPIALEDGGTVEGFRLLADGGVGGAWPEPGDPIGVARCPEGWARGADGACDPRLRADCPAGSEALPGGRCTPTSLADCPVGEYAEPGPEALGHRVVHVRAGADAAAADGTAAHPYGDIEDAIGFAGTGGWVLVARGTYRERPLATHTTVHVLGVCAAGVILDDPSPTGSPSPAFNARSDDTDVTLENVTIRAVGYGVQALNGARLRARAVVLEAPGGVGLFSLGAGTRVELSRSVIRGTRPRPPNGNGYAVFASQGAQLRLEEVVLAGNSRTAMILSDVGTAATLASCVVRGTRPDAAGTYGVGLLAQTGARVDGEALVFDDNRETGVAALDPGTLVALRGVVVRGTRPNGSANSGGISAASGASVALTDALVEGNTGVGVLATGPGTLVTLGSSVVRDTLPGAAFASGQGLQVNTGAALRADSVLLARNNAIGAFATSEGASMSLQRCVIRDTVADPRAFYGEGLLVAGGAAVRAVASRIEGSVGSGAAVTGAGSALALEGVAVRGTRADARGVYGRAVEAQPGARVRLAASLLADNREIGVRASGAELDARDLLVSGVGPAVGGFGMGLVAEDGARVAGARISVRSVYGAAIAAVGGAAPSRVALEDVDVREVRPSTIRVGDDGTILRPAGPAVAYGLHAGPGSVVEVARAVIDVGGYGVFNASGTLRVRGGVVSRQRDALGAFDLGAAAGATSLVDVSSADNAVDVLLRRADLPVGSTLAAPVDPCPDGC